MNKQEEFIQIGFLVLAFYILVANAANTDTRAVAAPRVDCEFDGITMIPGESNFKASKCRKMECLNDGTFKLLPGQGNFCKKCKVFDDPHVTQSNIIGSHFDFHKRCEYAVLMRINTALPFNVNGINSLGTSVGLFSTFRQCGASATCVDTTVFSYGGGNTQLIIKFDHYPPPGVAYHITLEPAVFAKTPFIPNVGDENDIITATGGQDLGVKLTGSTLGDVLLFTTNNYCIALAIAKGLFLFCPHFLNVNYKHREDSIIYGLCGRYKPTDILTPDFTKPDGNVALSANAFGSSWRTTNFPGCSAGRKEGTLLISEATCVGYNKYNHMCTAAVNKFGQNLFEEEAASHIEACLFDLCNIEGSAHNASEVEKETNVWMEAIEKIVTTVSIDAEGRGKM